MQLLVKFVMCTYLRTTTAVVLKASGSSSSLTPRTPMTQSELSTTPPSVVAPYRSFTPNKLAKLRETWRGGRIRDSSCPLLIAVADTSVIIAGTMTEIGAANGGIPPHDHAALAADDVTEVGTGPEVGALRRNVAATAQSPAVARTAETSRRSRPADLAVLRHAGTTAGVRSPGGTVAAHLVDGASPLHRCCPPAAALSFAAAVGTVAVAARATA